MPEVSVVSIAKNEREFKKLKEMLRKQTFRDFKFIFSNKKGIPQAWNDAIEQAKGKIIVVTESDSLPLQKTWLEEMVKAVKKHNRNDTKKRTVIRGIEVSPLPWCWCNFACYANVLKNNKLNESYSIAEDTELFSRLRKKGYRGLELPIAPVFHKRSKGFWKFIRNRFFYGLYHTKIAFKYGKVGFEGKVAKKNNASSILKREIRDILSSISFLFGVFIAFLFYRR